MSAPYDLNDDSVVVVIGSGAGGGTLGNELAQKGIDTVILEAGGRHESDEFINDEWGALDSSLGSTNARPPAVGALPKTSAACPRGS